MKYQLIIDIDKCIDCPCLEKYEDWLGFIYSAKCRVNDKAVNIVDAESFPRNCPLRKKCKSKSGGKMTFEEYIKNTNDINQLKNEFIEYHKFTLSFEAFMIEKLGKKQYDALCSEYSKFRANSWLKEVLEVNEA